MHQVVAYKILKNNGKLLTVRPKKWSRLLTGGGHLLEVPTVRLWMGKFWWFGFVVTYKRWSHMEVWLYIDIQKSAIFSQLGTFSYCKTCIDNPLVLKLHLHATILNNLLWWQRNSHVWLVFWFAKQRQHLHFTVILRAHVNIGPWYWTQVLSLCCQVFYQASWSCRTELNLCHIITHTEMNKYCVCILELCIFCRIFGSYNFSLSFSVDQRNF